VNALALSNEALGSHVENAVLGLSKALADLRPYIEELWTRVRRAGTWEDHPRMPDSQGILR
jgi:hypothetical protein